MSGKSLLDIAVDFDVAISTVSRRCADIALPVEGRGKPRTIDYAHVARLFDAGVSKTTIATRLGVTRQTVFKVLKAQGYASRGLPLEAKMAIRSAWLNGANAGALADAYGVSETTVRIYTRDLKRPRPKQPRKVDGSKVAHLRSLGLTYPVITVRLGVDEKTARAALRSSYALEAAE